MANWAWNIKEEETGAMSFRVSEPRDEELRNLVKAAGEGSNSITVTRRDGEPLMGKLADFPYTRYQLDLKISTTTGIKVVSWLDVTDVVLTPDGTEIPLVLS